MTELRNGWTVDLSSVEGASLSELADLALFAAAGCQAIDILPKGPPDELCSKLAGQARIALRRVSAPDACMIAFTAMAEGRRPIGDLQEIRSVMKRIAKALSEKLEQCSRQFDQLRGVRDL